MRMPFVEGGARGERVKGARSPDDEGIDRVRAALTDSENTKVCGAVYIYIYIYVSIYLRDLLCTSTVGFADKVHESPRIKSYLQLRNDRNYIRIFQ